MNTTTTKIAGEAMTEQMQANDRPTYIFLGPGDVIRATDERYSSTYHKWKPIAPLYVGSTVDASTRPVRRRALLASKPAVPEGWKLVPVELTEHMLDEADFAMQNHVGDAYTDADGFDGWYQPVWKAILAAAPTAPAQSCGDAEQADEAVTLPIMRAAFRVVETEGDPDPDKQRFHLRFTFRSMRELDAACDEWRAFSNAARTKDSK
jgi:hypothetical protein